jgi:UDP-2,3-diacylglucosamine pyrophosphatase LpxH
MSFSDFLDSFNAFMSACPVEDLEQNKRYVFLSDLHMGNGGKRDDLEKNRQLLVESLRGWYLERDYRLVLNGDIEELLKFSLREISTAWKDLYALFDEFDARDNLRKIIGNHDLALSQTSGYPYRVYHGLRLRRRERTLFVFHGHQASRFFARFDYLSKFVVRYLAKPLKIKNTSISSDSRQRFKAERRIYRASKSLGIVSLTGHTHRPLFESLSKYDSLRWSIEELLREYALAEAGRKRQIAELVDIYSAECERLGEKELRWVLSKSLYEEKNLLIPSIFNSGCATGKHGYTALEIEGDAISLVHWARDDRSRSYIAGEALARDSLDGSPFTRFTLRRAYLDQVFARIDLLGHRT